MIIHVLLELAINLVIFMGGIEAKPASNIFILFFWVRVDPADIIDPAKFSVEVYPQAFSFYRAVVYTVTDFKVIQIDKIRVQVIITFDHLYL